MKFHSAAVLLLLWLCRVGVQARPGYVETRDGRVYDGHLRFDSNTVIVANSQKQLWAEIALTNLASLTFLVPPPAAVEVEPEQAHATDALPSPWQSEDIGSVSLAGSAARIPGGFRVRGSGTNILAGNDAFHFVFKPVHGVSEIVARVGRVQSTDPWARAGLMMRE